MSKDSGPRMPGVGSQEWRVLERFSRGYASVHGIQTRELCQMNGIPHYTRAITQLRKYGWKIRAVPKPSRKNWTYSMDGRQLGRLRRLMKEGATPSPDERPDLYYNDPADDGAPVLRAKLREML